MKSVSQLLTFCEHFDTDTFNFYTSVQETFLNLPCPYAAISTRMLLLN